MNFWCEIPMINFNQILSVGLTKCINSGAPGTTPPRRLIRIANAQHVSNPMGGEGCRDGGHGPPAFVKGMMYNGGGGFVVPGHDRNGGGGGGLGFGGQGHLSGAGLHPHHAHPHTAAAHAPLGAHPFFYPPPSPSTDFQQQQQQQAAALGSPGHPYQVMIYPASIN